MRLPTIEQQNVWLTHVGLGNQARLEAQTFAGFSQKKAKKAEVFELYQFQTAPYMVARILDRHGREISKRLLPEQRILQS